MGEAKRRKQLGIDAKPRPLYEVEIITDNYSQFLVSEWLIDTWNKIAEKTGNSSFDIVKLVQKETVYAIAHYYQRNSKIYAEFIIQPEQNFSQNDLDNFSRILCKKILTDSNALIL
ncbi:MAG: hypothetical protein WBB28_21785 [Crinalium sp.]